MSHLIQIKVRSAWRTQIHVIRALINREIATRFGKYQFGFLWMLIEPLLGALFLGLLIGSIAGRTVPEIPYLFFILNGRIMLQIFQGSMSAGVNTVNSNHGLLVYKTVRPLDPFIARFIFQFFSTALSFTLFCVIGAWFGIELSIHHLHILLACALLTWLSGCAMGLIFGVAAAYYNEMEKVVMIIQMPLIFLSAVFAPLTALPQVAQEILLYNPLVHTIEQSRKAMFPFYDAGATNFHYPAVFAVVTLAAGLIFFRQNESFLVSRR
ncbi:MAG: ABC transporter permease [Akkermansiaceae bacterium]